MRDFSRDLASARNHALFLGTVAGGDGDQTLLNGVLDELRAVVDVDLPHEIVFVDIDGFDAEVQQRRDLLYRQAFGKQLENLALAGAQAVVAGARALRVLYVSTDHFAEHAGTQISLSAVNGVDREYQLGGGRVF